MVVLSANPLHDTGGGQRSAQLALEFLSRDFAVAFVSHGRVTESTDLGLTYEHPRLVELGLRDVDAALREVLATPAADGPSLVITQVPVASWLPVMEACGEGGFVTIYDCVDRWDSVLGRGWYRAEDERSVARAADVLVASAPVLGEHLERLAGREAAVLPNAFNSRIFQAGAGVTRPADLPDGPRTALYVGALWGDWMDWGLVRAAAEANEGVQFVFVGDHRKEGRGLPNNCHFLGLKPQVDLPGYLAAAEVAFLPWEISDVTQATSPLKVYEFMAMGLPVIAPDIEPLRGIDGVHLCPASSDFVDAFDSVGRRRVDEPTAESMQRFSEDNSWVRRVDSMLDLVAKSAGARRVEAPSVVTRTMGSTVSVVIPAYNHERYVGAAIDSVRDQTLPASELVIVDDGSSDRTREVIAAHQFPGMRVLSQENRGAHRALNRAISLSSGDYVAILNSDDLYEPEWLEHAWGIARASRAALVCGSVRLIDEQGGAVDPEHDIARWYSEARPFAQSSATLAIALRRLNVAVTTSNFFMHKELWSRLGGFSAYRYVHDYDFLLRAVELCGRDLCYEDSLQGIRYRVHGANTISENRPKGDEEHRAMKKALARPKGRLSRLLKRGPARAAVRDAIASAGSRTPVTESDLVPSSADDEPADGPMSATVSGPLRVGIVVQSLETGGLEEVVALLAQTLPSLGTTASVLCTRAGGSIADRLDAAGVPVHIADGPGDLRAWVRSEGVSVLSSHFETLGSLEELASTGVPIVETIQNTYAWYGEDDWESERRKLDVLFGTIAVSDTVRDYYHAHTGHRPRWVVPNAVHPGRAASVPRAFARRTLDVSETAPLFVSVGRITSQKNPPGLLRAFERVVAECPDAVLLMVGPTDQSVPISKLRSRHRTLFASGSVRHVDNVPDVGRVLSAADAFVSNSFYEGWSVAASEAAWTGLPVVLSDTGGAAQLVGPDCARGVIVRNPCGDALEVDRDRIAHPPEPAVSENESALSAALIGIVRDRARWGKERVEIRSHARATLAPVAIGRRYLQALGEAAAESSP